ncbi:MAG: hypothetical protein V7782_00260 [Psychromonas sp.]
MIIHHLLNQTSQVIKLNQYTKTNTQPSALNLTLNHMGIISLPDISVLPYLRTSELAHIVAHVRGPIWPLHTYQTDKPLHVSRFHHLLKQVFASQLVYGHNMSFKFLKITLYSSCNCFAGVVLPYLTLQSELIRTNLLTFSLPN